MEPSGTFVDPGVCRAKFDRELASYRAREEDYQRRGCWLLQAEFPEVFAVFATPKAKPPMVMFGAKIDFRNYDVWPPSVRIVDPFTRAPYKAKELLYPFVRRIVQTAQNADTGPAVISEQQQALMQSWGPEDTPFLCLPGVREYHANPGHSGDSWLTHRRGGEGSLFFIIDQLHRYGAAPIHGVNWQIQVVPAGFVVPQVPT